MKCRNCDKLIDQDTADEAAKIVAGMGFETLCVECATRMIRRMEIRSYTKNDAGSWDWDGTAWEAEEFSTDGNFGAYDDGEPIRIAGFINDELVAEKIGVVRNGDFCDDYRPPSQDRPRKWPAHCIPPGVSAAGAANALPTHQPSEDETDIVVAALVADELPASASAPPTGLRRASALNSTDLYPGFWHAVLLCVLFVALQLALITPIAIVDLTCESKLAAHPAVLGVVNLLDCALVLLIAWGIGRPHLPAVFAFRRLSALAVGGVVLATAGAVILLSEMDNLVRLVLPAPEWMVRYFREMAYESGPRYWASAFLLVLVAPVTEEVLFRGLILRGFLRRFGLARAFLLSALLFGATHLNPWQFVSGTALGLMFAWWYARTRSLIPSLLGHALANAVVLAHPVLGFKVRGFNASDPFVSADLQPLWFDGLGLVLLAAGLLVFRLSTQPFQAEPEPVPEPPLLAGSPTLAPDAPSPPPLVPPVIAPAPPASLPLLPPGNPGSGEAPLRGPNP